MIHERGLHLVTESALRTAQLEQQQREVRLMLLQVAIGAMDTVLDSLPDSSRACSWMADAIELAERVKESIDG